MVSEGSIPLLSQYSFNLVSKATPGEVGRNKNQSMMIHRVISFLLSALMLLVAYWHLTVGEFWLICLPYGIAAMLCFARVINYSWKYINLSIHIIFVLISLYFVGDLWHWINDGTSLDTLKASDSPAAYVDGVKSFFRLSIGAEIGRAHV